MPILRRRHDHCLVYRPNGTKYAECRNADLSHAVTGAVVRFFEEFGREPRQDRTLIEVLGVTGDWVAQLFEIMEPGDES